MRIPAVACCLLLLAAGLGCARPQPSSTSRSAAADEGPKTSKGSSPTDEGPAPSKTTTDDGATDDDDGPTTSAGGARVDACTIARQYLGREEYPEPGAQLPQLPGFYENCEVKGAGSDATVGCEVVTSEEAGDELFEMVTGKLVECFSSCMARRLAAGMAAPSDNLNSPRSKAPGATLAPTMSGEQDASGPRPEGTSATARW